MATTHNQPVGSHARSTTTGVPAPTDRRIEAILERIPRGISILDVGCVNHDASRADDPNWLHQHLDARGDVLGIDYLAADIRELQAEGWNVECADAEVMDLGETFDVIVAGELIEHLANPGAFLTRARDHLSDTGRLILTTPNPWGVTYLKRLVTPGEVHCNDEHTCWLDRRTLRQLLERHGFEVAEHEFIRPPIRRDGHGEYLSWATWHLCKQRRLGALDHLVVAELSETDA